MRECSSGTAFILGEPVLSRRVSAGNNCLCHAADAYARLVLFYSARSLDDIRGANRSYAHHMWRLRGAVIRGPNRSYAHHTWRLHGAVLASLKFPSFVAQHHSCRPLLFADLQ